VTGELLAWLLDGGDGHDFLKKTPGNSQGHQGPSKVGLEMVEAWGVKRWRLNQPIPKG